MTTIKVDTITNAAGSGAPNIPDGVTLGGTALASVNTMDYTASATQPTSPKNGAIWWNTGNDKFFQYMNGIWVEVDYTNLPGVWYGSRGLFVGRSNNSIDYITIASPGNAQDFGDLTATPGSADGLAGCSDGDYGLFGGGSSFNRIDYVTIATASNAQSFGSLSVTRSFLASCSDGTYGLFGGGWAGSMSNVIDYVTIATTGNATDFGDLTVARYGLSACSDATYGVFAGGDYANVIDYVTIATTGNATDFGDFNPSYSGSGATYYMGACSDTTRGVFGGCDSTDVSLNRTSYITIATPGNAVLAGSGLHIHFGTGRGYAACSDATYGVFSTAASLEYFTIQSLATGTDFGDLTATRNFPAACSGA